MIKNLFFIAIALLSFISCKKANSPVLQEEVTTVSKKSKVPGMNAGTLSGANIYYKDGYYWTPFAGGLKFDRFTYPTNPKEFDNYSKYEPSFSGPTSENNLLSFNMDGNRFTVVLGTALGGLVYKMRTKAYLDTIKAGYMPNVNEYLVRATTGDADGLIVHTGQFIIDHSAPLGVKIVDLTAYLPTPVKLPTLVSDMLEKDGVYYDVAIFQNTDKLYQITAAGLPPGAPKSVVAYNAIYTLINPTQIKLAGNMTLFDGTVYVLDDILNL